MSNPSTGMPVTYDGSVDLLLDSAGPDHRAPTWRDLYCDDPDLAIHGFLIPSDLSRFVEAAVGPCLRLSKGIHNLTLAVTETGSAQQLCYVMVHLADDLLISAAPFDVEQLLPDPGHDLEANAATVLAQIAERANFTIIRLASYVDGSLLGTGAASGSASPESRA